MNSKAGSKVIAELRNFSILLSVQSENGHKNLPFVVRYAYDVVARREPSLRPVHSSDFPPKIRLERFFNFKRIGARIALFWIMKTGYLLFHSIGNEGHHLLQ